MIDEQTASKEEEVVSVPVVNKSAPVSEQDQYQQDYRHGYDEASRVGEGVSLPPSPSTLPSPQREGQRFPQQQQAYQQQQQQEQQAYQQQQQPLEQQQQEQQAYQQQQQPLEQQQQEQQAYQQQQQQQPLMPPPVQDAREYYTPELKQYLDSMEVPESDPLLNLTLDSAQKSGMSVEQTHGMIGAFMQTLAKAIPEEAIIRPERELAKLGVNGKQVAVQVKGWLDGMKISGQMDGGMYNAAMSLGGTADGIKLLSMLRKTRQEVPIPTGQGISGGMPTWEKWYKKTYEKDKRSKESREQFDKRMGKEAERIARYSGNVPSNDLGSFQVDISDEEELG